jgi:hypothetical protein
LIPSDWRYCRPGINRVLMHSKGIQRSFKTPYPE